MLAFAAPSDAAVRILSESRDRTGPLRSCVAATPLLCLHSAASRRSFGAKIDARSYPLPYCALFSENRRVFKVKLVLIILLEGY